MRKLWALRILASVAALPVASAARAGDKIASIFSADMLQAQIAYSETITGPAMHISPA